MKNNIVILFFLLLINSIVSAQIANWTPGTNATYTNFPVGYTATDFVASIGQANVKAVRMLDSVNGVWRTLEVKSGQVVGANFMIPRVTALLVDMLNPIASWKP